MAEHTRDNVVSEKEQLYKALELLSTIYKIVTTDLKPAWMRAHIGEKIELSGLIECGDNVIQLKTGYKNKERKWLNTQLIH